MRYIGKGNAACTGLAITLLMVLGAVDASAQLAPCQASGSAVVELRVEQGQLVVRETVHLIHRSSEVKPSHDLHQHGVLAEQLVSAELLLFDRGTTADEVHHNRVKPSRRVSLDDVTSYSRNTRVLRIANSGRSDDPVVELLGGDAPSRALKLTYIARAERLSDAATRFRISLGLPVILSQKVGDGQRHAPLLCGPDKLNVRLRMNLPHGVKGDAISGFSNHEITSEPLVADSVWGLDEVITLAGHPPLAVWIDLPKRAVPEARVDPFGVVLLRFLYGDRSYPGVAPRIALSLLILVGLVWSRKRSKTSHVGSYLVLRVVGGNLALLAPLWLHALGLVHIERFGVIENVVVYGTWALDGMYLLYVFAAVMRSAGSERRKVIAPPTAERVLVLPAPTPPAPVPPPPRPTFVPSTEEAQPEVDAQTEEASEWGSTDESESDDADDGEGGLDSLWDDSPNLGPGKKR